MALMHLFMLNAYQRASQMSYLSMCGLKGHINASMLLFGPLAYRLLETFMSLLMHIIDYVLYEQEALDSISPLSSPALDLSVTMSFE